MTMTDLGPATGRLCALIEAVPERDLGRPTPCTEYTVGDILHHIAGVTVAFGALRSRHAVNRQPWVHGETHRSSILTGASRCPGVSRNSLRPGVTRKRGRG
jgi:uncharacterized protein (TIGR03083 family)